jgi:uncharacterized membrane protein YebE (DUF533 family)
LLRIDSQGVAVKHNDDEGTLLLSQCLASVSVADGDLDPREIGTMISAIEQVTGSVVTADSLVAISIDLDEDPEAFWQGLETQFTQIDDGFKKMILKTSIMIARADDLMIEEERQQIFSLGKLLGFKETEIEAEFKIIS